MAHQVVGSNHHPLQRVNEVLQVDVVSVGLDVGQEEVVDPGLDLTLEDHRQHGRRQLQHEDEADHAGELSAAQHKRDVRKLEEPA